MNGETAVYLYWLTCKVVITMQNKRLMHENLDWNITTTSDPQLQLRKNLEIKSNN